MSQRAENSLKDPISQGCSLHKSGYFYKDVFKC
jgi:hypothetical protein